MKRLGFVDSDRGWNWVKSWEKDLVSDSWNGVANQSGRLVKWFGVGVNLGFQSNFFQGEEISTGLRKLCNKWYGEDCNSLLLIKYPAGTELKPHVDRDCFDRRVVVVNFSVNSLFGGDVEFIYGHEVFLLSNGEVVEFNSGIPHGVKTVRSERWSLSLRRVLV